MAKTPPIESCFEAIERAIEHLEDGDLPLEKALSLYEDGLKHVRLARRHLDAFSKRLQAMRVDEEDEEDGEPATTDDDDEA